MIEILLTAGVLLIMFGIGLYTFARWMENNDE